jgi:hypothetical protein
MQLIGLIGPLMDPKSIQMAGDGAMGLLKRRIVGAAVLAATTLTVAASTATADPTFGVMNAEGGIYWRSGPDWNTPEATAGNGFYPNTIISVHCYQSGAGNVPGSADTMWEQATDVGGSGSGSGWINEHFVNDNQPINQPSPGVPPCNAPTPPPPSPGGLVFTVFNAEGGIYYRNSPHWADTPATPGVGVYNGDRVELICGASGDAVGPYNDTAWSYVNNLSRSVGHGWVNEHFINDGQPTNTFAPGEPMCGSDIPGATSSGGGGSSGGGSASGGGGSTPSLPSGPSGVSFNRNAAVAWAEAHAENTPPYHSACTWFVSQALWGGGIPQSSVWNGTDHHRSSIRNLQGTLTAWSVPLFVSYIKQTYPKSTYTELDLRAGHTNVPAARPGDVILYDWDGTSSTRNWSGLDHASLVIDDAKGSQYPEVAEWGADDFFWWGVAVKYKKRGWTWSQVSHEWLQKKKPHVRAFLLHIDMSQ